MLAEVRAVRYKAEIDSLEEAIHERDRDMAMAEIGGVLPAVVDLTGDLDETPWHDELYSDRGWINAARSAEIYSPPQRTLVKQDPATLQTAIDGASVPASGVAVPAPSPRATSSDKAPPASSKPPSRKPAIDTVTLPTTSKAPASSKPARAAPAAVSATRKRQKGRGQPASDSDNDQASDEEPQFQAIQPSASKVPRNTSKPPALGKKRASESLEKGGIEDNGKPSADSKDEKSSDSDDDSDQDMVPKAGKKAKVHFHLHFDCISAVKHDCKHSEMWLFCLCRSEASREGFEQHDCHHQELALKRKTGCCSCHSSDAFVLLLPTLVFPCVPL